MTGRHIDRGALGRTQRIAIGLSLAILSASAIMLSGCQTAPPSALDEVLRAQVERDKGNLDVALAALTIAIEKNPDLGLAYIARGEVNRKKGDYAAAASDFQKATQIEPNNFSAHFQLALMYQYLKKFAEAITSYQRAIEIRPLDPDANMNLAIVFAQTGEPVKGIPFAVRAVSGAPDNPVTHANLGALYAQVGYSDLAIEELKRSIELNSKQPEVYVNLAEEYLKARRYENARQVLENAAALGPSPAVSERLGLTYYKLGNLDKATDAYKDSLRQNPSYYQAMNGLGVMLMTQALRADPTNVDLARQAVNEWQKSLEVHPDQPSIVALVNRYGGSVQK